MKRTSGRRADAQRALRMINDRVKAVEIADDQDGVLVMDLSRMNLYVIQQFPDKPVYLSIDDDGTVIFFMDFRDAQMMAARYGGHVVAVDWHDMSRKIARGELKCALAMPDGRLLDIEKLESARSFRRAGDVDVTS